MRVRLSSISRTHHRESNPGQLEKTSAPTSVPPTISALCSAGEASSYERIIKENFQFCLSLQNIFEWLSNAEEKFSNELKHSGEERKNEKQS